MNFLTWSVFGQKTKHPEFIGRVRLQEILMADKRTKIIFRISSHAMGNTGIYSVAQWRIIPDDFTLMVM